MGLRRCFGGGTGGGDTRSTDRAGGDNRPADLEGGETRGGTDILGGTGVGAGGDALSALLAGDILPALLGGDDRPGLVGGDVRPSFEFGGDTLPILVADEGVASTIVGEPMAAPADKLEVMLVADNGMGTDLRVSESRRRWPGVVVRSGGRDWWLDNG